MKKLCSIITAVAIAAMPLAAFSECEDVKVFLDGAPIEMVDANGNEVTPIIIDGTTYLPIRAISKAMNLQVEWDGDDRAIYLTSDDTEIIATDVGAFSSLSQYLSKPYELLGRSFFLNPLKELMGKDYDKVMLPLLATCYITGNDDMVTLHCSGKAVIDVYKNGRIEAAVLSENDKNFGGKNVVRYYSRTNPDCIISSGLISFIAQNVNITEESYNVIDFVYGSGAPVLGNAVYEETNGYGGVTFQKKEDGWVGFEANVNKGDKGDCQASGSIKSNYGCWMCTENGEPSILFAFSGEYLTIIGFGKFTKVLTSVYAR